MRSVSGAMMAGASAGDELVLHRRAMAGAPVLPRDTQLSLSRRLHHERQAFVAAAFEAREVVEALLARWRRLRAASRSTGVLSAHHLEGSDRDLTAEIDRGLGRAARLFASRPRASAAAHRRRVARALGEAEVAVEVIVQALRDSGVGSAPPGASPEYGAAAAAFAAYVATRETLVRHNLRLVMGFTRPCRAMGVPLADLMQEGTLGLMRAVEKFDPERGVSLSTYAAWWIHQALIRAVQKESRTVRVPSTVYEMQVRLRRAESALRARMDREPGRAEVAEALGLSPDEADRIAASLAPIASTYAPITGSDSLALEDTLADDSCEDPAAAFDRHVLASALPAMLAPLEERERIVLAARFGLYGNEAATLSEVGARLGLSRERVRQIEQRALERIRVGSVARSLTTWQAPATPPL